MTTAEELLADSRWRRRNSRYLLWAVVPTLAFIAFLWAGFRAKKGDWVLWGGVYGILFLVYAVLANILDGDSDLVGAAGVALWITSGVHVLRTRRDYLRAEAGADAKGPWFAAGRDPDSAPPVVASALPPVDLNTATAAQLAAVFGGGAIEEVFAQRVVEERTRLGRFGSVEQAAEAVHLDPHLRDRLMRSAYVHGGQAPSSAPPPPSPSDRVADR